MSTIIVHETYIQLDIYIRIFPTQCACQRIKCKKERWRSPWLLHKVKVKDRPFAEGSRISHRTSTYIDIVIWLLMFKWWSIHNAKVWIRNLIENQQTITSVIEAIAIYHNVRKSLSQSFSASPYTQLSLSLSQLLTLTQYFWVWSFNRTQRKIGAYSFASQPFTSRVMSTIIVHANLHPIRYIYIMFFPTCWACQRIK